MRVASHFDSQGHQRRLRDAPASAMTETVMTAPQFRAAIEASAEHILISDHLDLRGELQQFSLDASGANKTIRVCSLPFV